MGTRVFTLYQVTISSQRYRCFVRHAQRWRAVPEVTFELWLWGHPPPFKKTKIQLNKTSRTITKSFHKSTSTGRISPMCESDGWQYTKFFLLHLNDNKRRWVGGSAVGENSREQHTSFRLSMLVTKGGWSWGGKVSSDTPPLVNTIPLSRLLTVLVC